MRNWLKGIAVLLVVAVAAPSSAAKYAGHPALPNVTTVTADFDIVSSPSGFVHAVSRATSDGTANPAVDLHHEWDFGADGQTIQNPVTLVDQKTGRDQTTGLAIFRLPDPHVAGPRTVTLKTTAWTGKKFVTSSKSKTLEHKPWAGQTRVFEPGSFDAVLAWVFGASNRKAVLRRGGVYSQAKTFKYEAGVGQYIVAEDAPGPMPVVRASAAYAQMMMVSSQQRGDAAAIDDLLFENIHFDGNNLADVAWFAWNVNWQVGEPSPITRIYWSGCKFTGFKGQALTHQPQKGTYSGIWRCEFDLTGITGASSVYLNTGSNFFLMGTRIIGGSAGDRLRDHAIYPTVKKDLLVRWSVFGPADKSYGINGNGPDGDAAWPKYDHFVVDGCLISGMQHGLDFGNSNNNPRTGLIDRILIQGTKIDLAWKGQGWQQPHAITYTNADRMTIRDCVVKAAVELQTFNPAAVAKITGYRNKGTKDARFNNAAAANR